MLENFMDDRIDAITEALQRIAESLDRLAQDQAECYKDILQKGVYFMDENKTTNNEVDQPVNNPVGDNGQTVEAEKIVSVADLKKKFDVLVAVVEDLAGGRIDALHE